MLAGIGCFVAAHRLDGLIGAWPAVLVSAAALAAMTFALVDLPRRRRAPTSPA